jgi:hypothetical protein
MQHLPVVDAAQSNRKRRRVVSGSGRLPVHQPLLFLPQCRRISDEMNESPIHRKRISFDAATWHALHQLSLDSMRSLQELADEAFRDLLKRHRRPLTLKDALRQSVRMQPANDPRPQRAVRRSTLEN